MNCLLSYSLNDDQKVFNSLNYKLGQLSLNISACTFAGKRYVDSPQKPNEDAFSVIELNNTLVAAVFDGVSSLKPITSLKDQTGARFASHVLKKTIENNIKGQTSKEIIRSLNKLLLEKSLQFEGVTLSDTHTLPSSTATIIQIDPKTRMLNLSHVGDSFCMVFYSGHSEFVTIDKNREYDNQVLRLMKKIAEEKQITPKEARKDERIKQMLLDVFQDSHNKADGTGQGVLNGDPNANQYIQDVSIPLESIEFILLGSDGIIPPGFDEQNEQDRKKMLDILKTGGLEELIRIKREGEDNDPDWHYVRYKHSDDATGIFIEII